MNAPEIRFPEFKEPWRPAVAGAASPFSLAAALAAFRFSLRAHKRVGVRVSTADGSPDMDVPSCGLPPAALAHYSTHV